MRQKNATCGGVLVNVSRVRLYYLRTEKSMLQHSGVR